MQLSDFDYALDPQRIALRPADPRDRAKLMVATDGRFLDRTIAELPELLEPGDVLVVNDSKVIPARLKGRRGDAALEVTLLRALGEAVWQGLARPAKRLKPGDRIQFDGDLRAEVIAREEGVVELRFDRDTAALLDHLKDFGEMPLPPYIAHKRAADAADRADYQTVFAKHLGSVAAPTAALHFTDALMTRLASGGITTVNLTLHVGAGTFLPIKAASIEAHRMHSEWGEISEAAAERLNIARKDGRRIIAIGTTALRLMESAIDRHGAIRAFRGETALFIKPGDRVASADLLLTNFHLPRSTLLMLLAAFAGYETMRAGYAHALSRDYRFYSYGDASLWRREKL